MSTPRADAVDPAEQRAMVVVGGVLVTLAAGYAAVRVSMVVQGDSFPGFWFGAEITVAFLISFLGAGYMIVTDRAEQDRSLLPAFALLLLGAAAGLVLADFVVDVPPYLAGVLSLVGLALLLIRRLRRRRTARLLSEGRRTAATIVDVQRSSGDGDAFYEETRYTLAFTGEDGARHTVAGRAMFPAGDLPKPGESVTVWYDPQKPARHVLRRLDATEPR